MRTTSMGVALVAAIASAGAGAGAGAQEAPLRLTLACASKPAIVSPRLACVAQRPPRM